MTWHVFRRLLLLVSVLTAAVAATIVPGVSASVWWLAFSVACVVVLVGL